MCVALGVQSGVRLAFSVFYVALRDEFGWSAALTASVFSVYMLVQAVCSPLLGWALDRFGVRWLFTLAALWVGASLAWCSQIQTLPQFFLTYGVLLAIGQTALHTGRVSVVLARWFPEMRGRAIALADIGAALGLGLYPPLSQWLITAYGWRWAFLWLGASVVLLIVPLSCWQREPPAIPTQRLASMPDRVTHRAEERQTAWTLGRAMGSLPFWMLFSTLLFSNLSSQVLNVHLMAILVGVGIVPMSAAAAVGMVNLVSLGGRVGIGWLTDAIGRRPAYTLALLCSMLGMAVLLGISPANASWVMLLFIAVFGLSKGSGGIVIASKAADVFHGERLGTIFGVITIASGLGGALGPWGAGWLVDRTGRYALALLSAILMAATAIICMWLVDVRPRPLRRSDQGAGPSPTSADRNPPPRCPN
jgi:MFS family permease